jgi:hypothetical protein
MSILSRLQEKSPQAKKFFAIAISGVIVLIIVGIYTILIFAGKTDHLSSSDDTNRDWLERFKNVFRNDEYSLDVVRDGLEGVKIRDLEVENPNIDLGVDQAEGPQKPVQ